MSITPTRIRAITAALLALAFAMPEIGTRARER